MAEPAGAFDVCLNCRSRIEDSSLPCPVCGAINDGPYADVTQAEADAADLVPALSDAELEVIRGHRFEPGGVECIDCGCPLDRAQAHACGEKP